MGKPYRMQERCHARHKLLKREKLDKIYAGVLCVCTHTSLEANPEREFIWKPFKYKLEIQETERMSAVTSVRR